MVFSFAIAADTSRLALVHLGVTYTVLSLVVAGLKTVYTPNGWVEAEQGLSVQHIRFWC